MSILTLETLPPAKANLIKLLLHANTLTHAPPSSSSRNPISTLQQTIVPFAAIVFFAAIILTPTHLVTTLVDL